MVYRCPLISIYSIQPISFQVSLEWNLLYNLRKNEFLCENMNFTLKEYKINIDSHLSLHILN